MANLDEKYKDTIDNHFKFGLKALAAVVREHYPGEEELVRKVEAFVEGGIRVKIEKVEKIRPERFNTVVHNDCWTNNFLFRCKSVFGNIFLVRTLINNGSMYLE